MIKLTKVTDYGVVLMTYMAKGSADASYNARGMAAENSLPPPMVSKILKSLSREGLLRSRRGAKGGYSLARPASEISLADVIDALEGSIAITECADGSSCTCRLELICHVRTNMRRISEAIRETLDSISLEELARPLPRIRRVTWNVEPVIESVGEPLGEPIKHVSVAGRA